jgi:hypothetical protein
VPPAEADGPLLRSLAEWSRAQTRAARAGVLAALVDATVYAAVSATATGEHLDEGTGLRAESGAELAVLLLEAVDGTRALPVFSDLDQLKRWRLDARPQRLKGAQACAAANDEGADQVVLDPATTALVLTRDELASLAAGWVPVPGSALATSTAAQELTVPVAIDPALAAALRQALRPEPVRAARLLQGRDGLVLGVVPRRPLEPAELAAMAQRLLTALGTALPDQGLGLMQVPARGPGHPVRIARFRRTR